MVTPDVFSRAELLTLGAAVDDEVARRSAHDTREISAKSTYEAKQAAEKSLSDERKEYHSNYREKVAAANRLENCILGLVQPRCRRPTACWPMKTKAEGPKGVWDWMRLVMPECVVGMYPQNKRAI